MTRLLQPLSYLTIRHAAKIKYDIVIPLIVSAVVSSAIIVTGAKVTGSGGLIDKANSLFGVLIGFFIAALAAVATFAKAGMDDPMTGDPPLMTVVEKGVRYQVPMSRRLFLSQLFGFLSVCSILTYVFGALGDLLGDKLGQVTGPHLSQYAGWVFTIMYITAASIILVNTLLGVFYLAFRIHDIRSRRLG